MSAITAKEMADYLWATLNKVVEEHYPEDEREEAKADRKSTRLNSSH